METLVSRETLLEIIKVGIKAISAYNAQPWRFALREDGIDVYVLRKKNYFLKLEGITYIEVGCVIENLVEGAAHFGFKTSVEILGAMCGLDTPIARLTFTPIQESRDIRYVLERCTNRAQYENTPIPVKVQKELAALSDDPNIHIAFSSGEQKDRLAKILGRLEFIRFSNYYLMREAMRYVRIPPEENEKYRDFLDLRTLHVHYSKWELRLREWGFKLMVCFPNFPRWYYNALKAIGYYALGAQHHMRLLHQNGALITFVLKKRDYKNFIDLGRVVQRILNELARHELAAVPILSGIYLFDVLQKNQEVFSRWQTARIRKAEKDINRLFDLEDQKIVFIIRTGFAAPPEHRSLRRDVSAFILNESEFSMKNYGQ